MSLEQYVGRKLGNYEIAEMIGKGGMAAVFRASQPSVNRDVAIKLMAPTLSEDATFVSRFKNEAQVIANLEHAHILPVYDFGEEEGLLYIVMRYMPSGTLEDRIGKQGMSVKDAVPLFGQLANALDYAHSKGIVHRDLKPANVMVDPQGNSFLSDFGIAKDLEDASKLTGTGGVVGTPAYMSPEQGLGDELDHRSDIYALGIILFEMLSGRVPFSADNPMAVMLKHINEPPPPLSQFNPEVPLPVQNVVLRALAKNPTDRYQSAEEMGAALRNAYDVATGKKPGAATAVAAPPGAGTLQGGVAARGGETIQSPVEGSAATTTAEGGVAATALAGSAPGVAAPAPMLPDVSLTYNSISEWVKKQKWIATWVQGLAVSLATFFILLRLTEGAMVEVAILSLVPGLLMYSLMRAPTVGALTAYILILPPLLLHAPGLAILWTLMIIVAGARLNSREIMLILVSLAFAGLPMSWLIPLLMPWWLRARRTVLPAAMGVMLAMIFAVMLGWPSAGGLLPVPVNAAIFEHAVISPFDTGYIALFDPGLWQTWGGAAVDNIVVTAALLGRFFTAMQGLPLLIAVGWAVAATLSVSNRRAQSPLLRAMGLVLALAILLFVHLIGRPASVEPVSSRALVFGFLAAVVAFGLSQWPLQIDPNAGNKRGTVLRLLRQTLGAAYVVMGLGVFSNMLLQADATPLALGLLWGGGAIGALIMLVNPLMGPPLVFGGMAAGLALTNRPGLAAVVGGLLFFYLIVSALFDRRRPRRWNPLGAGLIVGMPGLGQLGILPLGVISIGTLEAQVPAALLAIAGHVLLNASMPGEVEPLNIIIQVITTLLGVFAIERMMALGFLSNLNHKLRRLLFTVVIAIVLAISYYVLGGVPLLAGFTLVHAILLSAFTGAALVAALGDRAQFWRRFIEREEDEETNLFEDEEVTGEATKAG